MPTRDSVTRFDWLSISLHWSIAVFTLALFASGLWMVTLGYYDNWYYTAPWWHKNIGVLTAALVVVRWVWTAFRHSPNPISSAPHWQHRLARVVHGLMNLSLIGLLLSGYLMVTAKGDGLPVFDWFTIPALFANHAQWSDIAGTTHLIIAWFVIALASLHALAALKHHFIDKDATLRRMLALTSRSKP
jgi:cytochrome b561